METDKTLGLRNALAYGLFRAAGRWAPRTVPVEVFTVQDGGKLSAKNYNGVYVATEAVKRGKERVDIKKYDAAVDPAGGTIFVYDNDNLDVGDFTFGPLPGWQHPFILKHPDAADVPDGGAALLAALAAGQEALEADDWLARPADKAYSAFFDVGAAIDYLLLTELTKNPDGYRGSTYQSRDRGGRVAPGPPWDYDEAFGYCCGYPIQGWEEEGKSGPGVAGGSAISPEGWRFFICADAARCLVDPTDGISRWNRRMWQDPSFRAAASARWAALRAGPWADASVGGRFEAWASEVGAAAGRNYERYPDLLPAEGLPVGEAGFREAVGRMRAWTEARLAWLDGAFAKAADKPAVEGAADGAS
jgi:hypothetical protein